jgi:mannose-6-phosphate isomerase-like protein (cupin superfamily)
MFFCTLDEEALAASTEHQFGGPIVGTKERMRTQFLVNDPAGVIAFESFAPGDTVNWAFFHAETHVVLRGEAEITYTLPPNHNKIKTATARAGMAYLILNGTRARFRVTSAEPYVHVCVIMPRYHLEKYLLREEY